MCVELGPALVMVKGTGSPEVYAIYSRAMALEVGEDSSARFKALWGLYNYSMISGRLSEAVGHADELLELAQRLGADDLVLEGHHAKWTTSLYWGKLAAADEHSQEGISRYDCARHHALAFTFSGHDPGASTNGAVMSQNIGVAKRILHKPLRGREFPVQQLLESSESYCPASTSSMEAAGPHA